MDTKYKNWISRFVKNPLGTCSENTQRMQLKFPELIRVRGHYYCPIWGRREHWWLKTQLNEIIDPTSEQFPSKGGGMYLEWEEGEVEPTGKCLNCGDYCYNGLDCCNDICHSAFVHSLYQDNIY